MKVIRLVITPGDVMDIGLEDLDPSYVAYLERCDWSRSLAYIVNKEEERE